MTLGILLWTTLFLGQTKGNYLCVCNYNVEQAVLPYPDVQARPLGYLYEFDCKSTVQVTDISTQQWRAVAYLGQIGYLEVNSNIQETMCPGFVSKEDLITTTASQVQTLSTVLLTTNMPHVSSADSFTTLNTRYRSTTYVPSVYVTTSEARVPTEVYNNSTTAKQGYSKNDTMTSINVPGSSRDTKQSKRTTQSPNLTQSSYLTTQSHNRSSTLFSSALNTVLISNNTRKMPTGHTTMKTSYSSKTAANAQPSSTNMLIYPTKTSDIRTSVSTLKPTERYTMSTPSSKPNTFSLMVSSSSATRMIPQSFQQTIVTNVYTLPTTIAHTLPPVIVDFDVSYSVCRSDITLCPQTLLQYTREDNGALTQYGNKCYELVPFKLIWTKSELDCRAKGGHLITVQTPEFRNYIYTWIKKFTFIPAVWLGISDRRENGWFEWISEEKLVSTYWVDESAFTNRYDNCGIMLFDETSRGGWKAVSCGKTTPKGDQGSQYAFICEYSILLHSLSAGVIGR